MSHSILKANRAERRKREKHEYENHNVVYPATLKKKINKHKSKLGGHGYMHVYSN